MKLNNDTILISKVILLGDKAAFGKLVEKYQSPIRRFFLNQTSGNSDLSDDLAQETFIKAYINITSFKGIAEFSTWLYRIAYNVFYDYIRSRKEFEIDVETAGAKLTTETHNSDRKMDVTEAMKILKYEERTAIQLFYMEDLSIDKISGVMGCPSGTVKSHLSRGKEKLAVYFKHSGYEHTFR